jgi:[ribosomal protein S18]-alanine N-acetyltransferase
VSPPLVVEAATRDDLDALITLEQRSYSHPWTRANFEGELDASERGMLLLLREAASRADPERGIRGYCALQVYAGEMHLLNLAVAPEWRTRGLGRFLLRLARDLGARRGAREAWLEVRAGNGPAIALYESQGFREAGRRRGYYSRPREDALLLRAALGGPSEGADTDS